MDFAEMFNLDNVSNDFKTEAEKEAMRDTHTCAEPDKDAVLCTTVMMVGTIAECLEASAELSKSRHQGYSGAILGISIAIGLYTRMMAGDNEYALNENLESITGAIKEQAKDVDFEKAQKLLNAYGELYRDTGNHK